MTIKMLKPKKNVLVILGFVLWTAVAASELFGTENREAASCDANLTCARATKAATIHELSSGPDLSRWRLSTPRATKDLLRVAADPVLRSFRDSVTGMKFVLVPGACYRTERSEEEPEEVCLDFYYIGAYEVTFDEFDRFARATGRALPDDEGWGRGQRPVVNVSVYDALNFAKWLSRRTDKHFRLPTEVEWEHAARAESRSSFPWGDQLGENRANCDGCGSRWDGVQTAPVGSFQPNAWGLYDVVGNVGEWTCSMRDPDPLHSFERCDSIYKTRRRAYRNGGWSDGPESLGTSSRDWNVAMRRSDDVGFRLLHECQACNVWPHQLRQHRVAGKKMY